jgi:hypothetical protein
MPHAFPCPCCGHLVFDEPPGSYDICPICFWEDDEVQLLFPLMAGGANQPNLCDAQRTFIRDGACEYRFTGNVRQPADDEPRDPTWRPFDPATDPHLSNDSPEELRSRAPRLDTRLYYWRDGYWLTPNERSA